MYYKGHALYHSGNLPPETTPSGMVDSSGNFNYINTGPHSLVIRRNTTNVALFQANGNVNMNGKLSCQPLNIDGVPYVAGTALSIVSPTGYNLVENTKYYPLIPGAGVPIGNSIMAGVRHSITISADPRLTPDGIVENGANYKYIGVIP